MGKLVGISLNTVGDSVHSGLCRYLGWNGPCQFWVNISRIGNQVRADNAFFQSIAFIKENCVRRHLAASASRCRGTSKPFATALDKSCTEKVFNLLRASYQGCRQFRKVEYTASAYSDKAVSLEILCRLEHGLEIGNRRFAVHILIKLYTYSVGCKFVSQGRYGRAYDRHCYDEKPFVA